MSPRAIIKTIQCLLFGHHWFCFRLEGNQMGRCCTRCVRMEKASPPQTLWRNASTHS